MTTATVADLAPHTRQQRAPGTWDIGELIASNGWTGKPALMLIRPGTHPLIWDGNKRIEYLWRTGRTDVQIPLEIAWNRKFETTTI